MTAYAIQLQQAAYTYLHAVYTNYDVPSRLVKCVHDAVNEHDRSPLLVDHSAANGILVHLCADLYGSMIAYAMQLQQHAYTYCEVL